MPLHAHKQASKPGDTEWQFAYHPPMLDILPQLLLNALITGSIYALASSGLALTYGLLRILNFAHGHLMMLGAYTTFAVQEIIRANSPWLFDYSLVIAVPLGLLMGTRPMVYRLLEPITEFIRPIPSSAYIPVAILFLGIGNEMKIFVVFLACCFPILLNTSLNENEPIVHTPEQALNYFLRTKMDNIAIGRCLVHRPPA